MVMSSFFCLLGLFWCCFGIKIKPPYELLKDFKLPPSITKWNFINEPNRFAITSVVVDHHSESMWYLPSLHDKNSTGWNLFKERGFSSRPYACNIRMVGVGLESTLSGFETGGAGSISISSTDHKPNKVVFDKFLNESQKVHCFYVSNKGYGSNFYDTPKTYGLAIICPVLLDYEVGEYSFRGLMHQGSYCRVLAERLTSNVKITLFPTADGLDPSMTSAKPLISDIQLRSSAERLLWAKRYIRAEGRNHGVCTVQTFRNQQSGPMLYLFAMYYHRLGWSVIIYDRFENHREFLEDILNLPGIFYFPYTVYQLVQPDKYNEDYASKQGFQTKYYYAMEKNWVQSYGGEKADTADQDMDKTRTYDHAKLEFDFLESLLYVDADEFFYCPQASANLSMQRSYQQDLMDSFVELGVEEMRFIRIPYAGRASESYVDSAYNRAYTDFTNNTQLCMQKAFESRDEKAMFSCWSNASTYDDFPKSSDFAGMRYEKSNLFYDGWLSCNVSDNVGVCPFHYNHWSCDGMRGGGRDWGIRCRCKVAFDMINHLAYRPMLDRCHLLHFNDNKYRFQLIRGHGKNKKKTQNVEWTHDNGNITHVVVVCCRH